MSDLIRPDKLETEPGVGESDGLEVFEPTLFDELEPDTDTDPAEGHDGLTDQEGQDIDLEPVHPDNQGQNTTLVAPKALEATNGSKNNWLNWRRAGIGGGVAAGIFGLVSLLGGGSDSRTVDANTRTPGEEAGEPGMISTPPNSEVDVDPPVSTPEVPDYPILEPVAMTASTPEGVLGQFAENLKCFFNNRDYEAQQKCLTFIVGNRQGDLTTSYNMRLDGPGGISEFRIGQPDYDLVLSFDNTASAYYPTQAAANELRLATDVSDGSGTNRVRYTFKLFVVGGGELDGVPEFTEVWFLTSEKPLSPGEDDFES